MEQKKFIKRLSRYTNVAFDDSLDRSDYRYLEIKSWFGDIKALKALTSAIDFDCGFNDEGRCRQYRQTDSIKCCCNNCYSANGHLEKVQLTDIPKIAIHFRKKVGFWRPGKGCILPRELRSATCVTYLCRIYDGKDSEQSKLAHRQAEAITKAMRIFNEKIRQRTTELELS